MILVKYISCLFSTAHKEGKFNFAIQKQFILQKDTVAIIGASESLGILFAKGLSGATFRLLLMDKSDEQLNMLRDAILKNNDTCEVDINVCCKNASWEADIIIIAVPAGSQLEISQKIKEVATQKIVLFINPLRALISDLQVLLSHSNMVKVSVDTQGIDNVNFVDNTTANLEGTNAAAVTTAIKIMQTIGFKTIESSK